MELLILVMFVLGLAVGGFVGWVVRNNAKDPKAAEHRAEIANLQGQLQQAHSLEELLESAKSQLESMAKVTAAEALHNNNDQFLQLANENLGRTMETAGRELQERHQQFQELVKPLSENYDRLNPQIESLMQQNQNLVSETGKLSSALMDVRQVGSWGEVQLRRVVEMAHMSAHCDFSEQVTVGSNQERPDMVVHLPEGRAVVVDAKASVAAALEAQAAEDAEAANAAWLRHAAALKNQVNSLARKKYGDIVEGSLDFVIMFVPGDQFLAAALKADENLVNHAMSQKVAIATPSSLVAMLWVINSGWQTWEFAKNADEIRKLGTEMHERLQGFLKHYGTVQQRLTQTVTAFNTSVGTLESRVLVSARKMAEMRAIEPEEIAEVAQLETLPKPLASAEEDES